MTWRPSSDCARTPPLPVWVSRNPLESSEFSWSVSLWPPLKALLLN